MKKLTQTTPSAVNYERNALGEIHYTLLENIVFPKGSLSKANKILAQWIGDLREVPQSPKNENGILLESFEYNKKMNGILDTAKESEDVLDAKSIEDDQELGKIKKTHPKKRNKVTLARKEMKGMKKRRILEDSDSDWEDRKPKKISINTKSDDESLSKFKDCIDVNEDFDLGFRYNDKGKKQNPNKIDTREQKLLDSIVAHNELIETELKEVSLEKTKEDRKRACNEIKIMVSKLVTNY